MKKIILLVLIMAMIFTENNYVSALVMTPYRQQVNADEFVCGATFVLENRADYAAWLNRELSRAKNTYHLNTITVYGLESYDPAYRSALFDLLNKLDIKIVVRIEGYDKTFAFSKDDVGKIIKRHEDLIRFTCKKENRGTVLYYALNMPIDDPVVQANLGGVNSDLSKDRQKTYAEELIRRMREITAAEGNSGAKLYLSVFYGWDDSFEIPSYVSAHADGYFINNYAYPAGKKLPSVSEGAENVFNLASLKGTMDRFLKDYPNKPNLVVECGFHTLEYNKGVWPDQTAGLVLDRAAKEAAMKGTVDFYRRNYPFVRGIMYFGYNLFKEEGKPLTVLDWAMQYPAQNGEEAEQAAESENDIVSDKTASQGESVRLSKGQSIFFDKCKMAQQLVLTYKADVKVEIELKSGDRSKGKVVLPATSTYRGYGIPLILAENSELEIKCNAGELLLDKIALNDRLEAEWAQLVGDAKVVDSQGASGCKMVTGLAGAGNKLCFSGVRGGNKMEICYISPKGSELHLILNGEEYKVNLPASKNMREADLSLALPDESSIEIYENQPGDLKLDYLRLNGTPAVKKKDSANREIAGVNNGGHSYLAIKILLPVFAAIVAAIVTMITKLLKRQSAKEKNEIN